MESKGNSKAVRHQENGSQTADLNEAGEKGQRQLGNRTGGREGEAGRIWSEQNVQILLFTLKKKILKVAIAPGGHNVLVGKDKVDENPQEQQGSDSRHDAQLNTPHRLPQTCLTVVFPHRDYQTHRATRCPILEAASLFFFWSGHLLELSVGPQPHLSGVCLD